MVVAWAPLPKPCKPDTSSVVPLFKAPKGQEKFAGTHLATSKTNENDVDIGSTEIRKKNLQTTASSSTPTSCGMHTVMFYGWLNFLKQAQQIHVQVPMEPTGILKLLLVLASTSNKCTWWSFLETGLSNSKRADARISHPPFQSRHRP